MSAARVVHSALLVNDVLSGNACHYANNNLLPDIIFRDLNRRGRLGAASKNNRFALAQSSICLKCVASSDCWNAMPGLSNPGKKRTALAEAVDAIGRSVSGYVLLVVIMIVMTGAWAIFGPIEDQLMAKYFLQVEHVQVAKKPNDCKFETAPLGQKNCHYEKRVVLLNHAGEIIGGDEVTANGKHVVTKPTGKVADVYVNWVKIND